MADADASKLQFRPRARIIRTIGDQLISGPEAAVIELVKNAYDADASRVLITFAPPLEAGQGRITVADDGHGMTLSDIQEKWMEPATSSKASNRRSPMRDRAMMGSKGIGRFAAAKLGARMLLRSISDRTGIRQEIIVGEIDWSVFNGDTYLSDVSIDCLSQPTEDPSGTEIEINGLNEAWSPQRLNDLLLELRRLISPLDATGVEADFKIFLDLTACTVGTCGFDGALLVNGAGGSAAAADGEREPNEIFPLPLLTASDYEVRGTFSEAGGFEGVLEIKRAGTAPIPLKLEVPLKPDEDPCGPVDIRFFIFDREADAIKANMAEAGFGSITATDARAMLDQIAGVAVYRDGFRVRPYGDLANDWLGLDRRRVQDPSLRIGANQVAGYVTIEGQRSTHLLEKSSREGFEENGAFRRLRRLLVEFLAREVEPRRQAFREKAGLSRTRTTTFDEVKRLAELKKMRAWAAHLPEGEREEASRVIDQEAVALSDRIAALEDRHRILEAQSSLGAIIAKVLHEGEPSIAYVVETTERLPNLWKTALSHGDAAQTARETFQTKLSNLRDSGERLSRLFEALRPLAGGRRSKPPQYFRPIEPIAKVKDIFVQDGIPIMISGGADAPQVIGYPADLHTAMTNIIGNAVHWLQEAETPDPRIDVRITSTPSEVRIIVEDNGPGVRAEFVERIFNVGFTLKNEGTGLGLNIAREALERSKATLAFDSGFEEGARFIIIYTREGGNS